MLVDEFVEITVTNKNYKYLMDRGYEMPDEYKYINSKGNILLKFGFKILVYYFDLPESSSVKVKVKCDYPGCTDIHKVEYRGYVKHNHNGITYCSKHANTVFRSGEKHPLYNPNKEHDDIRKTPEYAITKLNVHERDKYTCVSCGKKIYNPVFHHLYSVNTHKELACKIDNGVTLCKKCHKNFHNIYGYGNNTPAQFIDYIKRELDWLEDYDKTKIEKKLIYCAELDETSTKPYFSKKLDIPLSGIYVTIDPNTGNKSVKGYHFISIQEKEKMKPEEFEKWKKNSLIEHENYGKIPKNERLVWHKETGEIKKAEDFLNTFGIKELRCIYDVCDRKQKHAYNNHYLWAEDYKKMTQEQMKEWEEWAFDKNERLVWHKESNQTYIMKELIGKFGIKSASGIYKVCDRKQYSICNQHFMWIEDYNEAIEDPKKMREWEEWITEKNEHYKKTQRLIWHKESNQFYIAEELVDKFGIKNIYNVYSVCNRKRKHLYNNHYLWAEDYKKMTQEQMREWEEWINSSKNEQYKKTQQLIWHKESNQFYTTEELVDKFGIKNITKVYSACNRKQKQAYNNHYLWAKDYEEMSNEQMKEWENWITKKNERLVWHKESGEIKKAKDFLNTFGIKELRCIYDVCDRKQHSIRKQHFMWIEDYNEAIKDPKKMREWEEWINSFKNVQYKRTQYKKTQQLIWHKESNRFYTAEELVDKFGIKNIYNVYSVCNRKRKHLYNNHYLWAKDYEEMSNEQMKEWENWITEKNERLVWHKESGEIKKAEDFLNTFGIKELRCIYDVCDRKQHSVYNQHFMWIENYNEAIEDPKKMREWEEWALNKNDRLIWHKETNQFYIAEELVGKFGVKNIYNIYSTCDRKQKHAYNNHFLWAEDYEKMTQEQMKEWENWILSKTIRNTGGQNGVKIVCVTENTIFNSIVQATKYYNVSNISKICRYNDSRSKNDNLRSAGNYKGRKLIWMYEKKFIEEYGIEAYNNLIQIK